MAQVEGSLPRLDKTVVEGKQIANFLPMGGGEAQTDPSGAGERKCWVGFYGANLCTLELVSRAFEVRGLWFAHRRG